LPVYRDQWRLGDGFRFLGLDSIPIQVGEQPHGKSDALHHCEIGGPPGFWQETVEETVLGQKAHASLGELNAGCKLQNSFLDWRSGEVRRLLYQHHRRLDGHRQNTENDSRDKSIGYMNYRSGDRNIFQEGLGYQSFPKHHRAQILMQFSVQGDEFQEHEQLVSYGVVNIHKCQRSILRRMKHELQHNTAIY
jgi:hypothetical protein